MTDGPEEAGAAAPRRAGRAWNPNVVAAVIGSLGTVTAAVLAGVFAAGLADDPPAAQPPPPSPPASRSAAVTASALVTDEAARQALRQQDVGSWVVSIDSVAFRSGGGQRAASVRGRFTGTRAFVQPDIYVLAKPSGGASPAAARLWYVAESGRLAADGTWEAEIAVGPLAGEEYTLTAIALPQCSDAWQGCLLNPADTREYLAKNGPPSQATAKASVTARAG